MTKAEYEAKISSLLNGMKERLKWLRMGTKALFGTLTCDNVCIVVDVSDSMQSKLIDVREKLHMLLKEQASSFFFSCSHREDSAQ